MSEGRESVKTIFGNALEIQSDEERARYLDQACAADKSLRREVDELLGVAGQVGDFLGGSSPADPTVDHLVSEKPGTQIGHYKLLEQIGEGGFGVVFMAEQTAPVKRRVAVKVIKPGMDTRQVIARFEAERQALALMDHPNIARVFDAGATNTGRPFFVMELVRGVPITQFCDEMHLAPRERLQLFVDVCQAVQHAHQKGIIHRDIKPSNVLVTLHDDKPVVKVIDFGVAKATSGQLTDKTVFTGFVQMIGTPMYMSPEQAAMSSLDVDTRSDIYSLGVLLYELLTGTTPFDKQRLQVAAFDEIRRIIREEEPQKPSTRLSTLGETLPRVAALRHMEPTKLSRLVRGELDWIVMKSLEKNRTRRYETANAFAADILRHLSDEPVLACPPSVGYRLRKFSSKYRVPLGVAAGFMLLLVASTLISTYQAIQIRVEQQKTLAQKAEADKQRMEAQRQRTAAQDSEQAARISERLAQQRLAESLTATGDARLTSRDILGARKAYSEAVELNDALSLAPLAAASGWSQSYNDSPAALMALHTERPINATSCAMTSDGRLVASGGWDGTCRLWDPLIGTSKAQLMGHQSGIRSLEFSNDGSLLISAGDDATARIWDVNTARELKTLRGHSETESVMDATFTPDATHAVTVSNDGTIGIWDVRTGARLRTLHAQYASPTWSVSVSPDGQMIASGGQYGYVEGWELQTGKRLFVTTQSQQINCVRFSPDGNSVLSADWSRGLKLWNLQSRFPAVSTTSGAALDQQHRIKPTVMAKFGPLEGSVNDAEFLNDGATFVSVGTDGTMRVWDTKLTVELARVDVSEGSLRRVAASSANHLAITSDGCIWDLTRETDRRIIEDRDLRACAVSPDGRCIVTGDRSGTLKLRDRATWRVLRSVPALKSVTSVCFLPDGRRVLCVGFDENVCMWDTSSGSVTAYATKPIPGGGSDPAIAASPDGRTVAFRNGDEEILIFDVDAWRVVRTLSCQQQMSSLTFSADGRWLLTGHIGRELILWDLASGVELRTLNGHSHWIQCVAISEDKKTAISGDWNHNIIVWDLEQGVARYRLSGHTGHVSAVAISKDGHTSVSASRDGTLRLWDLRTGKLVRTFSQQEECRGMALLAADTMSAIVAGKSGLRVWHFDVARALRAKEASLRRAQQALSVQHDDAEALREIGDWYAYRGRWDLAGELLERVEKSGAHVSPLTLARCAWVTGNAEDAKRFFERAAAGHEAPVDYLKLCSNAAARGNVEPIDSSAATDARLAALSDQILAHPEDPKLRMRRADLHLSNGHFEQAVADFDMLLRLEPKKHWHWYQYGCLLAYLGREVEHREHCREFMQRFSDSQEPFVQQRTIKVALLLPGESVDQIERWANQLREQLPKTTNDLWLRLIIGMSEYRAGQYDAAISSLKQARLDDNRPRSAAADAYLAMAYHRLENERDAHEALSRCVQLVDRELQVVGVSDLKPANVHDRLIAHVALRECKQIIGLNFSQDDEWGNEFNDESPTR